MNRRKRLSREIYAELPVTVWSNPLGRRRWTRIRARANGSGSSWRALLLILSVFPFHGCHTMSVCARDFRCATRRLLFYDVSEAIPRVASPEVACTDVHPGAPEMSNNGRKHVIRLFFSLAWIWSKMVGRVVWKATIQHAERCQNHDTTGRRPAETRGDAVSPRSGGPARLVSWLARLASRLSQRGEEGPHAKRGEQSLDGAGGEERESFSFSITVDSAS